MIEHRRTQGSGKAHPGMPHSGMHALSLRAHRNNSPVELELALGELPSAPPPQTRPSPAPACAARGAPARARVCPASGGPHSSPCPVYCCSPELPSKRHERFGVPFNPGHSPTMIQWNNSPVELALALGERASEAAAVRAACRAAALGGVRLAPALEPAIVACADGRACRIGVQGSTQTRPTFNIKKVL
jgi:hypothetical protein